jgi:hypothetical protein
MPVLGWECIVKHRRNIGVPTACHKLAATERGHCTETEVDASLDRKAKGLLSNQWCLVGSIRGSDRLPQNHQHLQVCCRDVVRRGRGSPRGGRSKPRRRHGLGIPDAAATYRGRHVQGCGVASHPPTGRRASASDCRGFPAWLDSSRSGPAHLPWVCRGAGYFGNGICTSQGAFPRTARRAPKRQSNIAVRTADVTLAARPLRRCTSL